MTALTRRAAIGALGAVLLAPRSLRADIFREHGPTYALRGRAVRGVDVVSYFTAGESKEGSVEHVTAWRGALWCFSSAEHQALFEANPRAYAPKYGGYCSYAMSQNEKLSSDPAVWQIYEGRLFFFHNPGAHASWQTDIPGNIAKANGYWPAIRHGLAS